MKKQELRQIIKEELKKILREGRYQNGSPILPVGKTDLKTGDNKILNIYKTWNNSYVNMFRKENGKIVGVVSAHKNTVEKNRKNLHAFYHDQTGRFIGDWTFIKEIPVKQINKYYKSLVLYTYK